jgi:hypothetical protein
MTQNVLCSKFNRRSENFAKPQHEHLCPRPLVASNLVRPTVLGVGKPPQAVHTVNKEARLINLVHSWRLDLKN